MALASRRIFAVAPPGLEPTLGVELANLGIPARLEEGGFEWTGGWDDLIQGHLHLRTASRLLVRVGGFRARALGELERKGGRLPWEDVLPSHRSVRFRISAGRSRIYHEGAAEERLQRVLAARGFTPHESYTGPDAPGSGPNAPGMGTASASRGSDADPDARPSTVVVRIFRDEVTVSVDATGGHLHQRGYRLDPGAAPLRETLAAGALLALGWSPTIPLLDPFAGSGTIAIEAALQAMDIPPALATADRTPRSFAFLEWPGCPVESYHSAAAEARRRILPAPPAPILASDRDAGALAALRRNAERAGVLEHLQVEQASLSLAPDPGPGGWVVTNPPYGARLGERKALRPLYRALGRRMSQEWSGRRLALFTADPVLERELRLDLEEIFSSRNGGIRVRLMALPIPG
jgi:putative N6-adenine-specific DNA methylase